MATNSNNQSFLNKSRLDKFIMVFQVPEALKKVESKTERRTYNLNEETFLFPVNGRVGPGGWGGPQPKGGGGGGG